MSVHMKRGLSLEKRKVVAGYLFALPFIVGFLVFMLYPLLMNLNFSFSRITDSTTWATTFVGLDNYIRLFTEDVNFAPALLSTIQQTFLWTPFTLVFALFLAVLLNRNLKGKGLFRVIFFLPVLLGTGYIMNAASGAASMLAMPESVDEFLRETTTPEIADFINKLLTEVLSNIWNTGVQVVIFLSGLQGISESYLEAARIDGANGLEQFWKITLPLLSPVILLNVVYTIIEGFRSTSNQIGQLIVNIFFKDSNLEYGAAMGWIYFAVVLVAVGLIFLIAGKLVRYDK